MPIYNEFGHITIDDARIDETCNAYFKWKDLNTYISNNSHRGINMPDAISEPICIFDIRKCKVYDRVSEYYKKYLEIAK